MEEKHNAKNNESAGGIGRTNFVKDGENAKQAIENKSRDIIAIDRQEGTMDHGTVGGGLPDNSGEVDKDKND